MKPGTALSGVSRRAIRDVVILACAIDAADKALLPATFKALSVTLGVGPAGLGAFSFAESMSFAAATPVWGALVRYYPTRDVMLGGCGMWGVATFLLAVTGSFQTHMVLRVVNGAALAAVAPAGQALLCDVIPEAERGKAFGLLQAVSTLCAGVCAALCAAMALVTVFGMAGWRVAYLMVCLLSAVVGGLIFTVVPRVEPTRVSIGWVGEQQALVSAIFRKRSFLVLVLQGVAGAIPWNGFSFVPLYLQTSGYTDTQAGLIMLLGGSGGVVGSYLGGVLGDHFAKLSANYGRVFIAQVSVVLGMIMFGVVMSVPFGHGSFWLTVVAFFGFSSTACWTPAAACRPICGEIFRDSAERAQVLAWWMALEGIASATCGAPLVGLLSEQFGFRIDPSGADQEIGARNVAALRHALIGVSVVPWAVCALAWTFMYRVFPQERVQEEVGETEETQAMEIGKRRGYSPVGEADSL
mmetsp:Transcript_80803/g.215662  ORF Transcript_80803/g.215662 Transcript_80803/m.215662 type:complete len:468 (-) Transcript_80803:47-1450(-)